VVRGRGSQFILKDYPGALHILVVAPLALRIKRIMESSAIKETEARKEIEHSDSSHVSLRDTIFTLLWKTRLITI